jgi:AcrR family transcriptional regulator
MDPTDEPRLGREDWFRMGLEALAENGPEALKAARLARRLGVTTGSFYWHFGSVADFQSELLEYWKKCVVVGLIDAAKANTEGPAQILAELRKRILESGAHRYDAAMRIWAQTDPRVGDTLREADEVRATFLVETLRKSGLSKQEAHDRASLIGAAWRGSRNLDDPNYRMKLIGIAAAD